MISELLKVNESCRPLGNSVRSALFSEKVSFFINLLGLHWFFLSSCVMRDVKEKNQTLM